MVGIDVTHVERIRSLMTRYPSMEMRFFSARERSHCRSHSDPMIHFAGTFAAKEAVIKALRLGRAVAWARRIEIVRDDAGAPTAWVVDAGIPGEITLSISHDENVAIAVAVSPTPEAPQDRQLRARHAHAQTRGRGRAITRARSTLPVNPDLGRFLGPHVDPGPTIDRQRPELTAFNEAGRGSDFP